MPLIKGRPSTLQLVRSEPAASRRSARGLWPQQEGQPARGADQQVQRAIDLMRAELSAAWSVTALARRVGLSRPVFARRFVASTGVSPMRYLAHLRMQRAAELLESSALTLAHVAEAVGYTSEFAFNRAFKRQHKLAPGSFRRRALRLDFGAPPRFRAAA